MDNEQIEQAAIAVKENVSLLSKKEQMISALIIKTQEDGIRANDMKVDLKKIRKAIEEKMDEYIKPSKTIISNAKDIINKIENEFRPVLTQIKSLEDTLGNKLLAYIQGEERKRKEQEQKNQEEMKKHQEKIDAGKNPNKVKQPEIRQVAPEVKFSGTHTRKNWTYEILNEAEIERQLCSPDSVKINAFIKQGGREAKGLRIYEKEILI